MCGLDPGIALGSTRVYGTSSLFVLLSPECGLPPRSAAPTYAVFSDRTSTFFHIWFRQTKYFNIVLLISTGKMSTRTPVVFTKMETRKKREKNETLVEEVPPPKEKLNKKPPKKVAKPSKSTATSKKREKTPALPKSPTPRKKGTAVRAEQIHLEGPKFGPPEEQPVQNDQPSLIALENAHLHAINQLSLIKMRQVDQEGGAAVQQTYVNEANAQLVLTEAALRSKWEAESDEEQRERQKNDFFHARSMLRTMTEDRGRAAADVSAASRASARRGPAGTSGKPVRGTGRSI